MRELAMEPEQSGIQHARAEALEIQRDPQVVEHFRHLVARALCHHKGIEGNALAELQTRCAKGEKILARSKGTYEGLDHLNRPAQIRKPDWAQWTNEVRASETCKARYSRELIDDYGWRQSQLCRILFAMEPLQINQIKARAHPSRSDRMYAQFEVVSSVVAQLQVMKGVTERYETQVAKQRAEWMARIYFIAHEHKVRKINELIGYPIEKWRSSRLQRIAGDVKRALAAAEAAALYDWATECELAGIPID